MEGTRLEPSTCERIVLSRWRFSRSDASSIPVIPPAVVGKVECNYDLYTLGTYVRDTKVRRMVDGRWGWRWRWRWLLRPES